MFFDTDEQTKKKVILFQASDIPIKRQTKIRSRANPYSVKDEPYFELRTQRKMLEKLEGRRLLETIFKRQNRRCAYCGELIELKTGWHFHHIVQRIHGGKETEDNLVVLHPNCHTSVHLNKFAFSKTQPQLKWIQYCLQNNLKSIQKTLQNLIGNLGKRKKKKENSGKPKPKPKPAGA